MYNGQIQWRLFSLELATYCPSARHKLSTAWGGVTGAIYIYIYIYIYMAVLEDPLTRMAEIIYTPRALSTRSQNREIPLVFKENALGRLRMPVHACRIWVRFDYGPV